MRDYTIAAKVAVIAWMYIIFLLCTLYKKNIWIYGFLN